MHAIETPCLRCAGPQGSVRYMLHGDEELSMAAWLPRLQQGCRDAGMQGCRDAGMGLFYGAHT
jgi:hypothetical protein